MILSVVGLMTFATANVYAQDAEGNTLAPDNSGAFQYAMEQALFNPLGELTVPENVKYIGAYAFWKCTALLKITLPSGNIIFCLFEC